MLFEQNAGYTPDASKGALSPVDVASQRVVIEPASSLLDGGLLLSDVTTTDDADDTADAYDPQQPAYNGQRRGSTGGNILAWTGAAAVTALTGVALNACAPTSGEVSTQSTPSPTASTDCSPSAITPTSGAAKETTPGPAVAFELSTNLDCPIPGLAEKQQMQTLVTAWLDDDKSNQTVQIIDSSSFYSQLGKELYPHTIVGIPIYQIKTDEGQYRVVSLTRGPDGKHAAMVTTFGNDELLGLQVPGYATGVAISQNGSGSLSFLGGSSGSNNYGIVKNGSEAMTDLKTIERFNFPADIRILDFDPAKIPVALPTTLTKFQGAHYKAGEADTKWSEGGPQPSNVVTKAQGIDGLNALLEEPVSASGNLPFSTSFDFA